MAVVKLVATLSSYGRRAVVVGGVADRYAGELARAGQSNRRRAGTGSASPQRATRPPLWPAGMAEGNRATFGPRVGLSSHGSPAKGGPKSKCLARLTITRTSAGPPSLTIADRSRFRFRFPVPLSCPNIGPVPLSCPEAISNFPLCSPQPAPGYRGSTVSIIIRTGIVAGGRSRRPQKMQVMKPVMPIKAYVKRDISTEQKGPEAPEPDPFADPAPGTFPCDLAAYLVELACLVYSPPPEVLKVLKGFDLRLMSSLFHVSSIPTEGKALIIVAEVNNVLYFRIIDGDGKVVVDTKEQRLMGQPMRNLRQLTGQARQIEDLRKQLESLWPPHELTWSDKDQVTKAVTSIVGHTLVKGRMCTDVQFFDRCDIQAVGFVHRGHKILVFRGTDSAPDWKYNLKICKSGSPRRHSGFKQAWEAVAPEITTWIASIPSPGPLILSGHSLGGALAILAAFELSARTPIKAIITFGAPRVGGRQFRHAYHQRAA